MNRQQCRAARALLDWSQDDLAAHSGISAVSIGSFETGQRTLKPSSLRAIHAGLLSAGVMFIDESDGKGVKLRATLGAQPESLPFEEFPMTPQQARSARAILNWSQAVASKAASVGQSLLVSLENGSRMPQKSNLRKIQSTYEAAGIRFFLDGDRPAVSYDSGRIID